jgi:hypothetical protein
VEEVSLKMEYTNSDQQSGHEIVEFGGENPFETLMKAVAVEEEKSTSSLAVVVVL